MSRWFLSIVCLLALALPLQAWATVAMMPCHGVPASAPGPDEVPCHESVATLADVQGNDPADTTAHTGCIACAACHGAAALPPTLPALPSEAPDMQALMATPASPPVFFTDGPERPPRTHLA